MRRIFKPHPVYGHQFIPSLRARVVHETGGYLVQTNRAGFRSNIEYDVEARPEVPRILLFGDSFTAGDGVRNADRFGDVVGARRPAWEIFNYGLPSSGTDQQFLIYREEILGPRIPHDLVVVAVLVENIRRNMAAYRPYEDEDGNIKYFAKPYFQLENGQLVLRNVPVPPDAVDEAMIEDPSSIDRGGRFPVARSILRGLGLKAVAQRFVQYQPVAEYDDSSGPHWQLMKAILEQWRKESLAPMVLMPIPLYQHVEETAAANSYQQRFQELHQPPDCLVHDALPYFQRYSLDERRTFRFQHDIHPTPAGHRVLAHVFETAVEQALKGRRACR